MKLLCYILFTISLFGCKAKYISQTDMPSGFETFDVKSYNSDILGYFRDNTYIKTDKWAGNYVITNYPNNKYYSLHKEFHKNGNIKKKGLLFGSIEIGVWEYYTQNGTLEKTIDKDKKFNPKFNYNHIIDYLHKRGTINKYRKKTKHEIEAVYVKETGEWGIGVYYNKTKYGSDANKVYRYGFDKNGKVLEQSEKINFIKVNH